MKRDEAKHHDASHARAARAGSASPWEWVAAASGALLVGAALAYMIRSGLEQSEAGVANLAVVQIGTVLTDGGYLVRFRARNTGGATAADVLVGGSLHAGGTMLEESEARIDYLAQRSHHEGGLIFSRDPARYELRLRVKGYVDP